MKVSCNRKSNRYKRVIKLLIILNFPLLYIYSTKGENSIFNKVIIDR